MFLNNQPANKQKSINDERLHQSLTSILEDFDCSDECRSAFNSMIGKKLTDKETLSEMIRCIRKAEMICKKSKKDEALYHSKRTGRNRCTCYSDEIV